MSTKEITAQIASTRLRLIESVAEFYDTVQSGMPKREDFAADAEVYDALGNAMADIATEALKKRQECVVRSQMFKFHAAKGTPKL